MKNHLQKLVDDKNKKKSKDYNSEEEVLSLYKDNIINKYENIEQHTILNDEDYRNYFIEVARELFYKS